MFLDTAIKSNQMIDVKGLLSTVRDWFRPSHTPRRTICLACFYQSQSYTRNASQQEKNEKVRKLRIWSKMFKVTARTPPDHTEDCCLATESQWKCHHRLLHDEASPAPCLGSSFWITNNATCHTQRQASRLSDVSWKSASWILWGHVKQLMCLKQSSTIPQSSACL